MPASGGSAGSPRRASPARRPLSFWARKKRYSSEADSGKSASSAAAVPSPQARSAWVRMGAASGSCQTRDAKERQEAAACVHQSATVSAKSACSAALQALKQPMAFSRWWNSLDFKWFAGTPSGCPGSRARARSSGPSWPSAYAPARRRPSSS